MGSSRLPGKVLLPAGGRPLLAHLIDRLRSVPSLDAVVLATTTAPADDALEIFAAEHGLVCHRGSEDDVMGRVLGAAEAAGADVLVEITGDCPIIDPAIVEQHIRIFHASDAAYVSNVEVRSWPDGMDTQVFTLETLARSAAMTEDRRDREHVTRHIRRHPEQFRPLHVVAPPDQHWPELGLTLDEEGDYELLRRVIERLAPHDPLFGCREVVGLLRDEHPEWLTLNEAVGRRGLD